LSGLIAIVVKVKYAYQELPYPENETPHAAK
jgi:hypothetical protein